jgi:hypothetical protein
MEIPAEVLVHNELLGVKGGRATLLRVSEHGYYEVNMTFGERIHRVLLPIVQTVIISREAEQAFFTHDEVER